jgi:hypothetical protein
MSDPIEQKLRQFIALSDTPVILTTFLDALLAEHRAEVEGLNLQATAAHARATRYAEKAGTHERAHGMPHEQCLSAARDAALEEGATEMKRIGEERAAIRLRALKSSPCAVLPVDKVREVLRAARGIHGANVDEVLTTCAEVLGVDLDAKCDCGHTSIGSNSLCMAPVRTAGGSIAACGCSHPSHAMPAKPALRENGCHPWCTAKGPHEVCLSDVLSEGSQ